MVNEIKNPPKISVVIPIYNVKDYLKKCLLSVSEQSLNNSLYEVILVDDKSTDISPQIIDQFRLKNNNFVVVSNKVTTGIGPARNAGIKISRGEYLFFIDGDDYIAPKTLETMLSIAESEKAEIVTTGFHRVTINENFHYTCNDYLTMGNDKEAILCGFFSNQLTSTAWGKLYKKSLFTKNNITYPEGIHEDIGVTFLLFWFANKIFRLNKNFYSWVERKESTTAKISKDHISGWFNGLYLQIEFVQKLNNSFNKEKLISSINQGFLNAASTILDRIITIKTDTSKARRSLYTNLFDQIKLFPNSATVVQSNKSRYYNIYHLYNSFIENKNSNDAMKMFEKNMKPKEK
ncbi:glycosyltransferase family 2 protein [bacterium]|nr:glycosyltransferase family 2 protein [bacterium]